ncbi:hypothetical protein SAMN05428949_6911 [Chitinophaga sp. YR627]|uniref:hypothetical protein n=1 Tax=Chitinophaga sp. YR627 TaxID=1881041 RepID=UPI0008E38EB4|nr:hypothetical protein [Chitinophaga sp. YR627]SFO90065.1 hypothetical protein SAMN05428949_6911 [Chitinophaga sp. YR627]
MLYKTNTFDPLDKKIYIDFGSPLRKDEPPLKLMYSYDLGIYLIREADKLKEKERVYDWTAFLIAYGEDDDTEKLIKKYFKEIKKIWSKYDYSDYEPIHESLTVSRELLDEADDWKDTFEDGREDLLDWFFDEE